MPATTVDSAQIRDGTVSRTDLNTTSVGQSVVAKLVQGTNVSLSSTGADAGTGDVTISAPAAISTDAGNIAQLGSDSLILVPQSTLWNMRLRSYNAVGNPDFSVDQPNAGNASPTASGSRLVDRWFLTKTGTMVIQGVQGLASLPDICVPGTNFRISRFYQRLVVNTAQASLAAGDFFTIYQNLEGIQWRELSNDVHSLSLLVRSSIAGLIFSVSLTDSPVTQSLVYACTIPTANTWTLLTLPNMPVWPTGSTNFSANPGQSGYVLRITLACGTTGLTSTSGSWLSGNFRGITGMSNFAATLNATFDLAFCQHEPGSIASQLQDKPFFQNYCESQRYYSKSYDLDVSLGTVTTAGAVALVHAGTTQGFGAIRFNTILAKIPTMTAYNDQTGAVNSVRLSTNGTDYAVTSFGAWGKGGYMSINTATMPTPVAGGIIRMHYIADTGW